jgi:CheY-like chemotaxis protein
MKIFLLDDDEMNNMLVSLMMEISGLKDVDVRTTGQDALAYLEECKTNDVFPDVMFVDINLPGMKGLTFVEHFERDYKDLCPACKIIMLTNSVLNSERETALKFASVVSYLNKPLTQNKLMEIISQIELR